MKRHIPQSLKWAVDAIGGLSAPSKMPSFGYSIPASMCKVGSMLRKVEGSTCASCYARKGRYVFPNVQGAMARRFGKLTAALANPVEYETFVSAFVALLDGTGSTFFRWHDSGDVQSVEHLSLIADIARRTPNVSHWLPTREYRTVKMWLDANGAFPSNLVVRLSAHMVNGPAPAMGLPTSGVHTHITSIQERGGVECRAYTRQGHCGDCRACWSADVPHVSYAKH
jgi:hypothetical protein